MVNTSYNIQTKDNGRYTAAFNTQNPNNITRGQGATFSFEMELLASKEDKTYSSNTTIQAGETKGYNNVTVESGVTLTINGTLRCVDIDIQGTIDGTGVLDVTLIQFDSLKPYEEWAGKYTINEMLDGTNKYRSQIPADADIKSLVFGIEPNAELKNKDVTGIWAILDGITDERNTALNINRYTFEMTVLAEYSDFGTHTSLENELKI